MLKERWQTFSLVEQLGNIGSEVQRAIYWKEKGDKYTAQGAADRVLLMIDLMVEDKRWQGRLKEVLRLREVFCDYFFELGNFEVSSRALTSYFLPFALAAQK